MARFEGGCLCGAVTYVAEGPLLFSGNCHCASCQRWTGSAFSSMLAVPTGAVKTNGGPLVTYRDTGDSGKAKRRQFCPSCGTTVLDSMDADPSFVMIPVGTLTDPGVVTPDVNVYWKHHLPWVERLASFPCFEALPPSADTAGQ